MRKAARDAGVEAGTGLELVRWTIAKRLADALDGALRIDDLPAILKLSQELDRHLPARPARPRSRVTSGEVTPDDGSTSSLDAAYADLCAELGDTPNA